MEGGFIGLAALGFWLFVGAAAVAGVWDGIRTRESEHETLRRIIETGKKPDQELLDKLLGYDKAPHRDLKVAGLIVIFVAPGLAIMGLLISMQESKALLPILGTAMLVGFVGIGLLTAAKFLEKSQKSDLANRSQTFR